MTELEKLTVDDLTLENGQEIHDLWVAHLEACGADEELEPLVSDGTSWMVNTTWGEVLAYFDPSETRHPVAYLASF